MKFTRINPEKLEQNLELAKAPFVRQHDEAKMFLLMALDTDNTFEVRHLCGILGTTIVAHGWERAIGILVAVWHFEGNNKYRDAIEVACVIMSLDLNDDIFRLSI